MSTGVLSWGFCPGGFVRGGFVRGVLSGGFVRGVLSGGVLSGGFCPGVLSGGFCPGGFCPGGFCPEGFVRGDYVQVDFVRGVLSRGVLSPGGFGRGVLVGGFCPGGFCLGGFCHQSVSITVKNVENVTVFSSLKQLNNMPISFVPKQPFTPSIQSVISNVPATVSAKSFLSINNIVSAERMFNWSQSLKCKVVYRAFSLPYNVKLGDSVYNIRPFVPAPIQCRRCCQFGHSSYVNIIWSKIVTIRFYLELLLSESTCIIIHV